MCNFSGRNIVDIESSIFISTFFYRKYLKNKHDFVHFVSSQRFLIFFFVLIFPLSLFTFAHFKQQNHAHFLSIKQNNKKKKHFYHKSFSFFSSSLFNMHSTHCVCNVCLLSKCGYDSVYSPSDVKRSAKVSRSLTYWFDCILIKSLIYIYIFLYSMNKSKSFRNYITHLHCNEFALNLFRHADTCTTQFWTKKKLTSKLDLFRLMQIRTISATTMTGKDWIALVYAAFKKKIMLKIVTRLEWLQNVPWPFLGFSVN